MEIKAVITAAGAGSRLCPLTPFLPKEMLPIAGLPAIHYVLAEVATLGVRKVRIVLSKGKECIRDYLEKEIFPKGDKAINLSEKRKELLSRLDISFAEQKELRGTADAIYAAEDFAGEDPLLVLYPDDLLLLSKESTPGLISLHEMMQSSLKEGVSSVLATEIPVSLASQYGVLHFNGRETDRFYVREIEEKPAEYTGEKAYAMIGRMVLCPSLIRSIPDLPVNDREGIIPALNLAAKKGALFAKIHRGERYDLGSHDGYLQAVCATLDKTHV